MTRGKAIKRLELHKRTWLLGGGFDLCDALELAIAALREQESAENAHCNCCKKCNGWISVEERLPTPYQNVIVWRSNYLDNSGCVDIDFTFVLNGEEVEWADHMRTWKSAVTHWMPMPEAPKEET